MKDIIEDVSKRDTWICENCHKVSFEDEHCGRCGSKNVNKSTPEMNLIND